MLVELIPPLNGNYMVKRLDVQQAWEDKVVVRACVQVRDADTPPNIQTKNKYIYIYIL